MAALNINTYYNCTLCENSDKFGNGCKINLMLPVLLVMTRKAKCNFYKFKNK